MSIADRYRPQFTCEEYLLCEGKWELVEGMPYAMSPSPILEQQIINNCRFLIHFDGMWE